MPLGPVEYVVIDFPDEEGFAGLALALAELEAAGTVHVLDLVFVSRDAEGRVTVREYDQVAGAERFDEIDGEVDGVLAEDDALTVGSALEPGTSAALIVWEDRWAIPFAERVRAAGGQVRDGARIPPEYVDELLAELGRDT